MSKELIKSPTKKPEKKKKERKEREEKYKYSTWTECSQCLIVTRSLTHLHCHKLSTYTCTLMSWTLARLGLVYLLLIAQYA